MSNSRLLRIDTVQSGHICSSVHCEYSDIILQGLSAQWDHPQLLQRSHGLPRTSTLPDRAILNQNQYSHWGIGDVYPRSAGCCTFVTDSRRIAWYPAYLSQNNSAWTSTSLPLVTLKIGRLAQSSPSSQIAPWKILPLSTPRLKLFHTHQSGDSWSGSSFPCWDHLPSPYWISRSLGIIFRQWVTS